MIPQNRECITERGLFTRAKPCVQIECKTPPTLIVTVDVEEDSAWSSGFKTHGNTVRNTQELGRFQELCDRHGVRPTYLVDMPVVEDRRSVALLRCLQRSGRCEIGAHLHPWCTPPFEEETSSENSWLCNLPEPRQWAKIGRITESIQMEIGVRPTSFRAGRYGMDIVGARILERFGYLVDSSVVSLVDYCDEGGPDFRQFPLHPYWIGKTALSEAAPAGQLLEIPVSVGFSRSDYRSLQWIRQFAERPVFRPFHLVGILDRLNLVRRIMFSPEQADARRMQQLVDAGVANDTPSLTLMLHSSSLLPGCSPYVRDMHDLDQLYSNLEAVFAYCFSRHAMIAHTLTGFAKVLQNASGEECQNRAFPAQHREQLVYGHTTGRCFRSKERSSG